MGNTEQDQLRGSEPDPEGIVYRTTRLFQFTNMGPAAGAFLVGIYFPVRYGWVAWPVLLFTMPFALLFFVLRFNMAFRYRVTFAPNRIRVDYGRRRHEILRKDVVGSRREGGAGMDNTSIILQGRDGKNLTIRPEIGAAPELMQWIHGLEEVPDPERVSIWDART